MFLLQMAIDLPTQLDDTVTISSSYFSDVSVLKEDNV
jgi:hypothetical protein